MNEREAWESIQTGNEAVGVSVLVDEYLYKWVPGSHASGFETYGYQRFTGGSIQSLVKRQRAFELLGGTSGTVDQLLDILGQGADDVPLMDPQDGENAVGLGGLASFKIPWWVYVLLLAVLLDGGRGRR